MLRALALILCLAAAAWAQSPFYLKTGDTVVFYGDSITDQRLYTTFTESYVLTRFPKLRVNFVHSGWGGDRVGGGGGGPIDVRLQRDVFPYKPTVMTIMLGMNDGRYLDFEQSAFDEFTSGYRHIIESVRQNAPGIRITVIQPSPFDDVTRPPTVPGGYNAVLVRYGQYIQQLGQTSSMTVADLNAPVIQSLRRARRVDGPGSERLIPDRVHPGAGGHLLMAAALLKAWNAPAVVSSLEMNADGQIVKAENTEVSGFAKTNGMAWTQTDRALPMPIDTKDAMIALAMRSSDIERDLDTQMLKITGLPAGTYALKIDGERVASFTADELGAGMNLALLPTPMARQAADVHALTLRHNDVHFARWRTLQVPLARYAFTKVQPAMDALDALEQEIIQQQRTAAQPKPHKFELRLE